MLFCNNAFILELSNNAFILELSIFEMDAINYISFLLFVWKYNMNDQIMWVPSMERFL